MGNNINKVIRRKSTRGEIIGYVGAGIILLSGVSGLILEAYDSNIDHTEEACLMSALLHMESHTDNENWIGATYGEVHQMEMIIKEYERQGKEVSIEFNKGQSQDDDMITTTIYDEEGNVEKSKTFVIKKY